MGTWEIQIGSAKKTPSLCICNKPWLWTYFPCVENVCPERSYVSNENFVKGTVYRRPVTDVPVSKEKLWLFRIGDFRLVNHNPRKAPTTESSFTCWSAGVMLYIAIGFTPTMSMRQSQWDDFISRFNHLYAPYETTSVVPSATLGRDTLHWS